MTSLRRKIVSLHQISAKNIFYVNLDLFVNMFCLYMSMFKYSIELLNTYTFLDNYNLIFFFKLACKLVKLHILNNYSFKQCINSYWFFTGFYLHIFYLHSILCFRVTGL